MESTPPSSAEPAGEWMSFDRGLLTISGPAVEISERLDAIFRAWAASVGAVPHQFPPVLPVAALDRADCLRSFPHFTTVATPIREDAAAALKAEAERGPLEEVGADHLAPAGFVLPPAACYAVYHHYRDRVLPSDLHVTVLSPCFRREESYEPARRQWAFWMREVVCVGRLEAVTSFLDGFRTRISDFLSGVGVPFTVEAATDPFFDRRDSKLLLQRLEPLKHEFRYRGSLSISSINYHRNFFGERFAIRDDQGHAAFSGCVGFGMERWLYTLTREFGWRWEDYPPGFHEDFRGRTPAT